MKKMADKFFEKSDAWLFATLKLMNKRKLLLKHLLRMGDILNHAIFNLEQINNGLSRLESEKFIELVGAKIFLTDKAKKFIKSNRKGIFEPCIEELYRYSKLFEVMPEIFIQQHDRHARRYGYCNGYTAVNKQLYPLAFVSRQHW